MIVPLKRNTMKMLFFLFSTFLAFSQDTLPKVVAPNNTSVKVEREIIEFCDQSMEAEFVGGSKAMQEYIAKNLVYPDCTDIDLNGKIYVSFVVEVNGALTNIEVFKSPCPEMKEVLIKLFAKMPPWLPGADVHGVTGRTRVMMPVQICFL